MFLISPNSMDLFQDELTEENILKNSHTLNSTNIDGSQSGTIYAHQNLAVSNDQSCAITDNGSVICWGIVPTNNVYPEGLPDAFRSGPIHFPHYLTTENLSFVSIDSSEGNALSNTCGITDNGSVYCWGDNNAIMLNSGAAGSGDYSPPFEIPLPSERSATAISVGTGSACAILDNYSLMCWGSNLYFALGMPYEDIGGFGVVQGNVSPIYVDFGFNAEVIGISAGSNTGCAILTNYSLYCWGGYPGHQVDPHPNPTWIDLGENMTAKAIDTSYHKCVILNDGSVKCWGSGYSGQLGGGPTSQEIYPTSVNIGEKRAISITTGVGHTCIILENNSAKCWGRNNDGQLGMGDSYNRGYPVNLTIPSGKSVIALEAGDMHTCALYDDGEIDCWGDQRRLGYFVIDNNSICSICYNVLSTGNSDIELPSGANINLGEIDADGDGAIEYIEYFPYNIDRSVMCSPGSYGNHSCLEAAPGHYVDLPGSDIQYECSPGTYQPYMGQSNCFNASLGNFVPIPAQSEQSNCTIGTFQPLEAQFNCINSEPGYFVPIEGSELETPCPPGTYQPYSAQSSCLDADLGYYVSNQASISQQPCIPGSYQPMEGQTYCIISDPGYFVNTFGSDVQTPCIAGTYQPNSNSTQCISSDIGYYVELNASTTQYECIPGTFQPNSGRDSCIISEPGYHVPFSSMSQQIACHDGTYQPDYGGIECLISPPGYYTDTSAMISPEPCPPGTFQPLTGQNYCIDSSPGHYVPNWSGIMEFECGLGTYQPSFGAEYCILASTGHYVDSNASTAEIPASINFFVEGYGQTLQTPCPIGHLTLEEGSYSEELCLIDSDGDGNPDEFDNDDDNDGWDDVDEILCETSTIIMTQTPIDSDGDNECDIVDNDDDNDGWIDSIDSFPLDSSEWADFDGDGVGDNSDDFPSISRYQSYSDSYLDVFIFVIITSLFLVKKMNIGKKDSQVTNDKLEEE